MQRINRSRGFTLVEVLVVVGIVALLMGVMLPAINRVRETSRRTTCMGNLRVIGQGLLTYARDNKDEFPRIIAQPTNNDDYLETHEPDATVTSPFANSNNGKNAFELGGVGLDPILRIGIYPENAAFIALAIIAATLLAGLYPAWRAGRVNPVESINLV